MAELFPVPEVAAGATEVVVSEWLVKPGEAVTAGQPIAVIETEKAVVEVEAETDATMLRSLIEPGSSVEVGAPLALLGTADEVGADIDALLAELGVGDRTGGHPAAPRRKVPDEVEEPPAPGQESVPQHQPNAPSRGSATTPSSAGTPRGERRVPISPIARKLLREAGLSVDGIEGTGPHGRVRRRDVEPIIAAATSRAPAPGTNAEQRTAPAAARPTGPATAPGTRAERDEIPHSRLRRAVARRLTESKQQVPHFYLRRTAVLDDLLALRARVNEASPPTRISVNDFLVRAIAVAHTQVPDANVIWTDEAMHRFSGVDIAVAVASERGLVTPVLRGVEHLSLSAISAQVKDLVALANDGKLQQSDLEGGSISISNLGMFGVEEFSAIINPPQSAILAVGAARPAPVVVGEKVTVRTAVELVLSVDHRAIDGALAARWMSALVDAIHQPLRLLV